MGTVTSSEKNVKGLDKCPYVGVLHKSSEHQCEFDICDTCEKIQLCHISCESPKNGTLHRICDQCLKKEKSQKKRHKYSKSEEVINDEVKEECQVLLEEG